MRPLDLSEGSVYRSPLYLLFGQPPAVGPATQLLAELFREQAKDYAA